MAKLIKNTKYYDFGEILNDTNIADEGIAYSEWITNGWWIKRMIILVQSTQSYEVIIYRSDGTTDDWGDLVNQGLGATGTAYASITYEATELVGKRFRFGLRNKSGGATSNFKLKLQCFDN